MFTKNQGLTIENVLDGTVAQRINCMLEEAVKNCLALDYDLSTRKVKVTLRLTPNEERNRVQVIPEFEIIRGKQRMKAFEAAIGINAQGKGEAREFISRQQELFNQGVTPIRPATAERGEPV